MQDAHEPTDTEERRHEAPETVQSIFPTFFARPLRNNAQHNARKEREENCGFKMVKI
jgi:hypothetical protein